MTMASLAKYEPRWAPANPVGLGSSAADRRAATLIEEALLEMQGAGHHAVRIVDANCGSGATLIRAVVRARALGFVAIEGRGVDVSGDDIMIAGWATKTWQDPAIGLSFEVGDIGNALEHEDDAAVDILLCAREGLELLPIIARRQAAREIRRIADRLVLKGGHRGPAGEIR
jgi:hypothetical protein